MGFELDIGKVTGVRETMAALDQLRPELHEEMEGVVNSAGKGLADAVNANIPGDPPMSGFDHGGRTSWGRRGSAKVDEGSGSRSDNEWPVFKVVLTGAASSMTDIAGAAGGGDTDSGRQMTAVLNARNGGASRWVWPAALSFENRIESAMEDAAESAADTVSDKIGQV